MRSSSGSCIRGQFSNGSRPSSSASARTFSVKAIRKSEVDNLLFGPNQINNNHLSKPYTMIVTRPQSSTSRTFECNPDSQIVRVITQESIRHLHAQNEKERDSSLKLTGNEYRRLLDYTPKSIDYKEIRRAKIRQKEMESNERRVEFSQLDKIRIARQNQTDIQKKNEENSRTLIKKAWEDRIDNEEEVRIISNMIRNAKTQTIRDKQILENRKVKKLKEEEDMRLNKLVEIESDAAFMRQQDLNRERLKKEYIGAHTMVEQIEENKQKRLKELELLVTENLEAKQQAFQRINDHKMNTQIEKEEQRKKKDEFVIANKSIAERKLFEKMEEKLIDEKILKIQMEKEKKERIKENEMLKRKTEKEIEYSKMLLMQEKFQDLQTQRDELLERRANEAYLRRWREKELVEEIKKKEVTENLKMVRAIQKHMAIVRNAAEANRDRTVFQQHFQNEKMLLEKDRLEEETKQNKKHLYAKALTHQMEQNKVQRIVDDYRLKLEQELILKEDKMRQIRIKEAKVRKLEESRLSGVAEKYLLEIERRVNNPMTFIRH